MSNSEPLTEQEIALRLLEQKATQQKLEDQLSNLRNARVQQEIDRLADAQKKREKEKEEERLVLLALAQRKAERDAEEAAQTQRELDARKQRVLEEQKRNQEAENERRRLETANRALQDSAELTRRMELETAAALAELQRGLEPEPEPVKPATLNDNPLGQMFLRERDVNGNLVTKEAALPVREISLTEHTQMQAKLDKERESQMPKAQGTLSVDGNTLAALQRIFKDETQEMCNSELMMSLLSNFNASKVEAALKIVAAEHKVTRMSVMGIVTRIRMILESEYETPVIAQAPAPVKKELPTVQCPTCRKSVPYLQAVCCKNILNIRSARSAGLISAKEAEDMLLARGQK